MSDGTPIPLPPCIRPNMIFTLEGAAAALAYLGLGKTTLKRECRLGRLQFGKRGGKILIRGRWLLDWVEASKVQRGKRKQHTRNGTPPS